MKRIGGIVVLLFITLFICSSFLIAAQYDSKVYQAQKALKAFGYNPGRPDGLWGKSTERAVKYFQVDNEHPVTGKLDEQTKTKLGLVSLKRSLNQTVTPGERRIALVIGNGTYRSAPLRNPVNDTSDIADALIRSGFEVDKKLNVPQETMEDAIREFGSKLHEGTVGLFYYSGHGVQVSGRNYLIPIGARIVKEKDVKYKAVDLYQVLDEMGSARNGLNIVILDACRDNPLKRSWRSKSQGLMKVEGPKGTLIAYSTAPGAVAEDGEGRNGTYTKHLLRAMNIPGLPVEQVFKEVLKAVDSETGGKQTPWMSSSFTGDFYFASRTSETPQKQPSVDTTTPPLPPSGGASFDDIMKAAEEKKKAVEAWDRWQGDRVEEYNEVRQLDKDGYVNRKQKIDAWKRFSAAVSTDNPHSAEDDEMRSYTRSRIEYWKHKTRTEDQTATYNVKKVLAYHTVQRGDSPFRIAQRYGLSLEMLLSLNNLTPRSRIYVGQMLIVETGSKKYDQKDREIGQDSRFIAYDNGTVKDTETGLMWAAKDNRGDINWRDAKRYCENYQGGGYTDWRMPTQDELAGLYDKSEWYQATQRHYTVHLTELIELSTCCQWASETRDSEAASFVFMDGGGSWLDQFHSSNLRVLPVRSGK